MHSKDLRAMGENELRIDLVHEWFEGPRATVIANVQLLPGPRPSCCRFGFLRLRLRGLVNAGLAFRGGRRANADLSQIALADVSDEHEQRHSHFQSGEISIGSQRSFPCPVLD